MKEAYRARFISEQSKKTRLYGTVTAVIALVVLPYFYYADISELGLDGTLLWRGLGFVAAVGFLLSLLTKPGPRRLLLIHGLVLLAYLVMMLGIAALIFREPAIYGEEQQFAVTTGVLTILAINTFTAQGSRPMVMWGTILLVVLFAFAVFPAPLNNPGYPVSIMMLGLFAVLVLRVQDQQEKEKSSYLYELEEKESRIARQSEELEEVNSNLIGFNYAITHDLKSPLRRAQSFTQLVERRLSPETKEELGDLLDHIKHNHARIQEIIQGLTLLNKIGKSEIAIEKVDLEELVGKVWCDIFSDAGEGLRAELDLNNRKPVSADPKLMWHILQNLLSNAVKYSQKVEHPTVEIGTLEERTERVVYVKDNGAGFPSQFAHQLGRPFKRLHSSHDFEGTGVGLAIVRQIAELHGGRFWAEGEEGEGATFYCAFPAQNGQLQES